MESPFDTLEPVETDEQRDVYAETVEEYESVVGVLGEAYVEWGQERPAGTRAAYSDALDRLDDRDIGPEQLHQFCREERLGRDDGLFVSAATATVDGDPVYLPGMPGVHDIGYRNEKDLRIRGSVGDRVGREMYDGLITVRGRAGDATGKEMRGGTLTLLEDAGEHAGQEARDGTIHVLGDTGKGAGTAAEGATVHVHGSIGTDGARRMRSGILQVDGDAGANLGDAMDGGNIAVGGDVESVGTGSRAGSLYVAGEIDDTLHHDAPALVRKPWQLSGIQRPSP